MCVQRKENQTVVVTCDLGNPMKHRQKVSESPIPLKQMWVSFILKVARFQTSDSNHKIIFQLWLSRKTSKRCRTSDLEVWRFANPCCKHCSAHDAKQSLIFSPLGLESNQYEETEGVEQSLSDYGSFTCRSRLVSSSASATWRRWTITSPSA